MFIAFVHQSTFYICTIKWHYFLNLYLKRLGMRVVICKALYHHQARMIGNQQITNQLIMAHLW